jgi:hypothetical protein
MTRDAKNLAKSPPLGIYLGKDKPLTPENDKYSPKQTAKELPREVKVSDLAGVKLLIS